MRVSRGDVVKIISYLRHNKSKEASDVFRNKFSPHLEGIGLHQTTLIEVPDELFELLESYKEAMELYYNPPKPKKRRRKK